MEQRATRADVVALNRVLIEQFIASQQKTPEALILDIDASDSWDKPCRVITRLEFGSQGANRTTMSTVRCPLGTDMNTLTVSELKRRGMAAIEDGLRSGPVHIVKRNKPAAVVLTEDDYKRLVDGRVSPFGGVSAVQWLLNQHSTGKRSKAQIDDAIRAERNW